MDDKCSYTPGSDCPGFRRAEEVAGEVKALNNRLNEFQQNVSETNSRFGARIGKLEAREEVRDEQYEHIKEKLESITRDVKDSQKDQRDSIGELRREHKASMDELKKSNKEILDTLSPLKHKAEEWDELEKDVEELKSKSGKTWEDIKSKAIGWILLLVLGIVAVALGLEKYL